MDLFTIQCTTCKARLVVRDASVIGDILSCPKCESMVQIVPPPDWKSPPGSSSSPGELTVISSSTVAQPQPKPTPKPGKKKAAAVIPPALPVRTPTPEPAVSQTAATQPTAPPAPTPANIASETTPAFNPSSLPAASAPLGPALALTRSRQEWLVLGGGLAAGVMLGAAAWFVMWMRTPAQVIVAQNDPASIAPAQAEEREQPADRDPPASPVLPEAQVADAPVEATVAPEAEAPFVEKQAPPEPTTENVPPATAASPTPPASKGTPALKLEPIVGSKPDVPGVGAPTNDATATDLLDSVAEADDSPSDAEQPAPNDDLLDHGSPGEPAPLAAAQIEQRLGVELARVEFANVSLAQFATFIGDMTGVPVVLDETSLTEAGKSRKTPVAVRLSNTTALAALRAASQQVGLTYAIEDGQIVISAAPR